MSINAGVGIRSPPICIHETASWVAPLAVFTLVWYGLMVSRCVGAGFAWCVNFSFGGNWGSAMNNFECVVFDFRVRVVGA